MTDDSRPESGWPGENLFSPQGIRFGQTAAPAAKAADFGPAHARLQAKLDGLDAADPLRQALTQQLAALESRCRAEWLAAWNSRIRQAFQALIEQVESPQRWRAPASESLRQRLLEALGELRKNLQAELLGLLPAGREALTPIQRFVTAQLTKLDALQLRNASAYEKSREVAAACRSLLIQAEALPRELLALAELDKLLDTAVRYQFAWDVALAAKGELDSHLTALQQIAVSGLRPPRLPQAAPVEGLSWGWVGDQLCNDLGVPLRALKGSYREWMKRGLMGVQRAVQQGFASAPLLEALEAFYCAHSLERERPEALVAIAWMLTLFQRPVQAVDCLELALRREPMAEIKPLFWQIQALDPENQPKPRMRKPRPGGLYRPESV